jgi:hypothetical protein
MLLSIPCRVVVIGERDDGDDRDAANSGENKKPPAPTPLPDQFVDGIVGHRRHVVDPDRRVAVGRHGGRHATLRRRRRRNCRSLLRSTSENGFSRRRR